MQFDNDQSMKKEWKENGGFKLKKEKVGRQMKKKHSSLKTAIKYIMWVSNSNFCISILSAN